MSETGSEEETDVKCSLCGDRMGEGELITHLRDEHEDDREEIQESYGLRTVSNVFDEESESNTDDTEDGPPSEPCPVCGGRILKNDGEVTQETVRAHLRTDHADQPDSVVRSDYESIVADLDGVTEEPAIGGSESEPVDEPASSSGSSATQRAAVGNKFSIFGVGGAGNHILDAFLMRRDTLDDRNSRLVRAWEGGIQTYIPLNTNNSEVLGTYYAQRDQSLDRTAAVQRCVLGFDNMTGQGAGEDPIAGIERVESDIDNAPDHTFTRWPFTDGDVDRAQAGLFLHSVVKGTGTGATPPLARYIRDDVLEREGRYDTPMVSFTILPNERRVEQARSSKYAENCGFGFGRMATEVDLIIPFGNMRLERVAGDITPDIDGIEDFGHGHGELNRPLVQFAEAFMLTSNAEMVDMDATSSPGQNRGFGGGDDGFDVPDAFRPVADVYPLDEIGEVGQPGVVGAPVFGRLERRSIDESGLQTLINSALRHGRLVDFDPATAWGAVFILFGPEDIMETAATYINNYQTHSIVEEAVGEDDIDIRFHQAVVDQVDNLHLWGLFWNPHLPALESMYEQTKAARERNDHRGKEFTERWERVEPVYNFLGKENRSS